MTKASMVSTGKQLALTLGVFYDEFQMQRLTHHEIQLNLANLVAMGRMAIGNMKDRAKEPKLKELLDQCSCIGLCA